MVGPGGIANSFADAVREATASSVVAVGSRSIERAEEFAGRHGIPRAHGSYEDLVADPDVEAVYVASPHSAHHEHALLALRAGKPVLVEKAFTRSLRETEEVLATARSGTCWRPRRCGAGTCRATTSCGRRSTPARWARWSSSMRTTGSGSGPTALLGCPSPSLAEAPSSTSASTPSRSPTTSSAAWPTSRPRGTRSDLGVDVTTVVSARGPSGELAQLWCSMAAATSCPLAWSGPTCASSLEGRFYDLGPVRLVGPDESVLDEYVPEVTTHGFRYEIAEFARALEAGRSETWSMPWDATRRVMAAMDDVRRQVGVVYPGE